MTSYSMTSVSLNNSYCLYFSRVILHHSSSFCINLIGCFRHGPRSRSFGKGPSWLFQRGQFLPLRPSVRCVFRKYDTEAPWFKEHLWGCGCDFANPSALLYLLNNTKAPYLRYRAVCLCLLPLIMLQMTSRLSVPGDLHRRTWTLPNAAEPQERNKWIMKMKQAQLRHTSAYYNTKHAKVQHRLAMWCWPMLNSTGFGYR